MERAPFTSPPDHGRGKAARAGAAALYVALGATALCALAYFESLPARAEPRSDGNVGTAAVKQSGAPAAARAPLPASTAAKTARKTGRTGAETSKTADLSTMRKTGRAGAETSKSVDLSSTSAAAAATDTTAAPAPPATLTVPSFRGKRLSQARREAEKLGLVVSARDDEGERVPSNMARYYRVRRQLTKAGTPVEAGAAIDLRVEEDDAVMGY